MGPKHATAPLSTDLDSELPDLRNDQSLADFTRSLSRHIDELVQIPRSFEHLRAEFSLLSDLVEHLSHRCSEQPVVAALLILKWHNASMDMDDLGLHETRGFACEIVAWRFLSHVDDDERMHQLLDELPGAEPPPPVYSDSEALLGSAGPEPAGAGDELVAPFRGWNALETATAASAKKFLSQRAVQDVVTAVWRGDIVFWSELAVHARKRPQVHGGGRGSSIYSRLRVPMYVKAFEAAFFASFLGLYYAVLLEAAPARLTATEMLLYVWIAAFALDEFGELRDVGTRFWAADMWNLTDLGILGIALAFVVMRAVGLARGDQALLASAMDVFSLEALLLVPRMCALLSLHPFFGTLLPCLKKMSRDFLNFLGIVAVLYVGFLTTFTMLGRATFSPRQLAWYLVYVLFGSSYLGFDIASDISPLLGPPLMVVFVCLTNILLITSLISLLSNTLDTVMAHAREEYLFQYSVFVLEASASRRLTYYFPPFNLVPLILIRPFRPLLGGEATRSLRIKLFRIHFPYAAAIWLYERGALLLAGAAGPSARGGPLAARRASAAPHLHQPPRTPSRRTARPLPPSRHSLHGPPPPPLACRSEGSLVRAPATPRAKEAADLAELKDMVAALSRQVRDLAAKMDCDPTSPREDPGL